MRKQSGLEKNLPRFGLLYENEENLISPALVRLTGSRVSRLPVAPQTVPHILGNTSSRVHAQITSTYIRGVA
jgi:hypothetical protein